MKFCNNPTCPTYTIKVDVEAERCISCSKELVSETPFSDLISDEFLNGLFGRRGRK